MKFDGIVIGIKYHAIYIIVMSLDVRIFSDFNLCNVFLDYNKWIDIIKEVSWSTLTLRSRNSDDKDKLGTKCKNEKDDIFTIIKKKKNLERFCDFTNAIKSK